MEKCQTCYADNDSSQFYHKVVFVVNSTCKKLIRSFDSEYLAKQFVDKVKRSKNLTLISYPNFH